MKTKYLVRFLNRAAQFDADIELADVFSNAVLAGQLTKGEYLFEYVDPKKHTRLAGRKVTTHNRGIALNHLKATLRAAFLKDIYEDVATYLTELLAGAAKVGLSSERLIGEHKINVEVNDILACKNWETAINLIAEQLFRRIENEKSTIKLLCAIDKKLDLRVPEKVLQDALPYLELRHLLVHSDGIADESFCKRFPEIGANPNQSIYLSYSLIATAREKIVGMISKYDECAVAKKVVPECDLQP